MTINDRLLVKYTGRHFKNRPSINPIRLIENVKIVQFMFCKCCCFIILQGLIRITAAWSCSSCHFFHHFKLKFSTIRRALVACTVSGLRFKGDFRAVTEWCVLLSCIWVSKVRSNHVRIFLLKRNFDFLWFSVKFRFLISRMWTQITLKNDRKLYHCGLIALERHVKSWF